MAALILSDEYLSIDSVALCTPAWIITDHAPLWASPEVRGADLVIPHATGARPLPRRVTVSQIELEMRIVGDFDQEGNRYSNVRLGLQTNIEYLRTYLTAQPTTSDGTRTATLYYPTGSSPASKTAAVHVLRLRLAGRGPALAIGQLELSFPSGGLA